MESPGQDQQTEGQLHPSGCQEDKLPTPPLPLLPHALLNSYPLFTISVFVYLYSLYLHILKLYVSVFLCLLLVLTVCTKGLRVTQFQFSVCMCCTCGRIDNKADFDVN